MGIKYIFYFLKLIKVFKEVKMGYKNFIFMEKDLMMKIEVYVIVVLYYRV